MKTKSILLTSSGLKNIINNVSNESSDFCFFFGKHELRMNSIYAEFISPTVSRLHQTDPTINSIHYNSVLNNDSNISCDELFNQETMSLLLKIATGFPIDVNEEQSFKMQLISIMINNEELFDKINELYPFYINESNVDFYLQHLQIMHNYLGTSPYFNYSEIIDFISSHFYSIDESKLLKLPKSVLHSIISNNNFKVENEDSLLNFINRVFSNNNKSKNKKEENENISIIEFYEEVEFSYLSRTKFQEFLKYFEFNDMTKKIWSKLCKCFFKNMDLINDETKEKRYLYNCRWYQFDGRSENCFKGIIHHLTEENGGNVDSKGIVKVTSSSIYNEHFPKIVVDFNDNQHFYESLDKQYSWVKFNFQDKKVKPTHYSIKSRNAGKGSRHLKNWVIEGSNTNYDNDWLILDTRNDVTALDGKNSTQTFEIQRELKQNDSFRYLRIRQTGVNTSNDHYLTLSALEFFGSVYF